MAESGPTQTTDGSVSDHRWTQRPAMARLARIGVAGFPLLLSILFSFSMSHLLPPARLGVNKWIWWVGLVCVTTLLLSRIDRVVRRLAPMSALLGLSLVFPDEAPSRYKSAMRSFSARKVQTRLDSMREAGFTLNAEESRSQTMLDLLAMLSDHDRRTRGHSERVRAYADMIGREMKLSPDDLDKLQWAALLHDLGKLTVPSQILNKDGRPDEAEWKLLQGHPAAGVPLAAPIADWLGEWTSAIGQHHERWDGGGYPDGVGGHDLPLAARIVSIADAYDVMTSSRSYKKAFPAEVARQEVATGAGGQFCPTAARAFLAIPASRLKAVAGPISWMGGLPGLRNVPVAEMVGSTTISAASATLTAVTAISIFPSLAPAPAAAEPKVVEPVPVETTIVESTTTTSTTQALPEEPADLIINIPTVGLGNTIPQIGTTTTVPIGTTTTTPSPATATTTTSATASTTTTTAPTTTTTPTTTSTTTTTVPPTTTTTAPPPPPPGVPVVAPGQTFNVGELAANGTTVGTVAASDSDSAITGFAITAGNGGAIFSITAGGVLSVVDNTSLDFETATQHVLTITATDGTNTSNPTSVTVIVNDANDMAPTINPGQVFAVSEASTVPTPVGTVVAGDVDSAITGFTITAGNTDGIFAIDSGGTIRVADDTNLDFETTWQYILSITATDGTNTSSTASVTIDIVNDNDVAPVVDPAQIFVVTESANNGTSVGTVSATDADSAITGFSITAGNSDGVFAISAAGLITVADNTNLDYEATSVYLLSVTATDGPNTSAARTVTVNISDVIETGSVLISEFTTTGPGGAADDFIELYNPTGSPVSLIGWTIQLYNGAGNPVDVPIALGTGAVTSIAPNSFYLLEGSSYSRGTAGDQAPLSSNIAIGGGAELISNTASTIDTVGSASVGTPLPRLMGSTDHSYERKAVGGFGHCVDTDIDVTDFIHSLVASTPTNSTAPAVPCGTPPPPVAPVGPSHLVISEFRTSGPGGPNDEFVELFNPTSAPVDLLGYELRKSDNTLVHTFAGSIILGAGRHYTLAGPSFTGQSDAPYSEIQTFASSGSIRLTDGVSDQDVVGMSAGGAFETQPIPAMTTSGSSEESYERLGSNCQDTDDNGADFSHNLASINPQILTDPATPCPVAGLGLLVSQFSSAGVHSEGDFVELYNSSGVTLDVSGYEVRLSDDVSVFETVTIPPATTIPDGGFYLLALAGSEHDTGSAADQLFTTPLPLSIGIGIHDGASYVDQVGTRARPEPNPSIVPAALLLEGTGVSPFDTTATTVKQTNLRRAHYGGGHCVDTDDNSADFFRLSSSNGVRNTASPAEPCGPTTPPPPATNHLVIKEIRTDGPLAGNNEFIEIFNPTSVAIAIGGLELRDSDGDIEHVFPVLNLQPGQHYLVGGASYAGPVDATYSVDGVKNGGSVWIWDPIGLTVIDDIDFDTNPPQLPVLGGRLEHSYNRRDGGCTDTDTHRADFEHIFASTPKRSVDAAEPCP